MKVAWPSRTALKLGLKTRNRPLKSDVKITAGYLRSAHPRGESCAGTDEDSTARITEYADVDEDPQVRDVRGVLSPSLAITWEDSRQGKVAVAVVELVTVEVERKADVSGDCDLLESSS